MRQHHFSEAYFAVVDNEAGAVSFDIARSDDVKHSFGEFDVKLVGVGFAEELVRKIQIVNSVHSDFLRRGRRGDGFQLVAV